MSKVKIKDREVLENSLSIIYDIDKAMNILSKSGINIEDTGTDENTVGSLVCNALNTAWRIAENSFDGAVEVFGDFDAEEMIDNVLGDVYSNDTKNKEKAIEKSIDQLKKVIKNNIVTFKLDEYDLAVTYRDKYKQEHCTDEYYYNKSQDARFFPGFAEADLSNRMHPFFVAEFKCDTVPKDILFPFITTPFVIIDEDKFINNKI